LSILLNFRIATLGQIVEYAETSRDLFGLRTADASTGPDDSPC